MTCCVTPNIQESPVVGIYYCKTCYALAKEWLPFSGSSLLWRSKNGKSAALEALTLQHLFNIHAFLKRSRVKFQEALNNRNALARIANRFETECYAAVGTLHGEMAQYAIESEAWGWSGEHGISMAAESVREEIEDIDFWLHFVGEEIERRTPCS